jgi:hypothetical protein
MVLRDELGNVAAVRADYRSNSTQVSCTREPGDLHLPNSATGRPGGCTQEVDWCDGAGQAL